MAQQTVRETQGQIQVFGAEENQTFPMDVFIPSSAVSSLLIGSAAQQKVSAVWGGRERERES